MYLQDIFTVHANLTGHPAISLPLGRHSNGLPFGIQLMGKLFAEKELFALSSILVNNSGNA
jgi:aspartyl-tRNA(Asn)/glutamyl-tRNA(Gln) amidotransferase subunit A